VTRPTRTPVVVGAVWLSLAIALAASGRLEALRPPVPQLVLVGLTVALLLALAVSPRLRAWAWSLPVRSVVTLHLLRFVGIYFLLLYRKGQLPYAFAVPGGWGDILVATLASLLLLSGPPSTPRRRVAYIAWNGLGLVDIVLVVATAARLGLTAPDSMRALLKLPLSLLPTFLVPLIIASHVVLAIRLGRGQTVQRAESV
jgi:hypothetical protein